MRVRLEDVCERGASNLKQSDIVDDSGNYPIYGASGHISNVDFYHQNKPYVAVVKDGAGIGRTTLHPAKSSVIGTMQYLIPKKNVLPEYLYYVVCYMHLEKYFTGATIPHIYFKDYKNEQFNLDSLEKQKEIIDILGKCENVINVRKKELQKLDKLIKARFAEMFASKNYPREELDNLSYGKGEYGAQSASVEYNSSRPRYVRITDIKEDGSLNDDVVCSANVEDDKLYKLKYGDFCFARMGATVGKTYAYRGGNQIFAGYLIRYKLNLNRIIPEYLYEFTRLHDYKNWVSLNQSGAAQPGINAKKYGSLRIPVAPLEEQRVFAKFVEQVNKSKVKVQKALDEAQLLFDSLMQKYFG